MSDVLFFGMVVSAAIGLLHALYVYREGARGSDGGHALLPFGRRVYYALWTFFLWLLFGAYALLFWFVSVVVYVLYQLVKGLAYPIARRKKAASSFPGGA